MNYNYTLTYRLFDSVLDDIRVDMRNYAAEGRIEPAQLIKVALKINYKLGMRIIQSKDEVVDISNGHGRLPDDFFSMNYAFLCNNYRVITIPPQGTHLEHVIPAYNVESIEDPSGCGLIEDPCKPTLILPTCLTKCGTEYSLIQTLKYETREYDMFARIKFVNSQNCDVNCPNTRMVCPTEAYIKDGFLHTNFSEGKVYINYQGALVNSNGDLLVPDHPLINDYLEYGLKQRILENIMLDNERVPDGSIQTIEQRFREARREALSFVRMPNFSEMQKVWAMNRKAAYSKYYDMFKSTYPDPRAFPVNNAV